MTWGVKNKSCPNELKFCEDSWFGISWILTKFELIRTTNKKVLFLKKIGVLLFETVKNLIFWIVTRVSTRDYTCTGKYQFYSVTKFSESFFFEFLWKFLASIKFKVSQPFLSTFKTSLITLSCFSWKKVQVKLGSI